MSQTRKVAAAMMPFRSTCRPRGPRAAWLAAGLALALSLPAFARMYEPPKSFSLPQEKAAIAQVQRKVLPRLDAERLLRESRARGAKPSPRRPQPLRFAVPSAVSYTLGNSGTWQTLADGSRLWRLRIQSAGSQSLNLGFARFDVAPGVKLWVYNPGHTHVEGPYTVRNRSHAGRLFTPVIEGDEIVVEVWVPAGAPTPAIEIGSVNRAFRGLKSGIFSGSSEGACENDVICPAGNAWRDQIDAVAVYTIGGTSACTGQMLNDTAGDFKNYFLSAHHCGVDATNDDTVVVYWNFQSPTCGTHDPGPTDHTQTGSTFRASFADSDFQLIELSDTPDSAYHVFYGGWDASGTAAPSLACIHQPSTDVKAISFSNSSPASTAYFSDTPDPSASHWRVNWDSGVTEEGSSGSCIWNTANKRCVGQLHGGPSACGVSASDLHDFYGKLSVSWDGGGTAATRLRDWLDPGSTGVLGSDGARPAIAGGPVMRLEETVLDYGGVELGFAFTKAIVIHNDGDADLVVSAASASPGSPDLTQWPVSDLAAGATIAAGAAPLVLKQEFLPTSLGAHQIGITVTSNDPAQPSVLVQLKGSGISPIPIDSVLVLDRSGSMSETAGARRKIDALGTAADLFANLLRPDSGAGTGDKIGLVKYNDTNQVYSALAFADDPATAGSHIADIDTKLAPAALADPGGLLPQGSTGIGGGMQTGAAQLPLPAGGRKHVMVVLTDGIENVDPRIDAVLPGIHAGDSDLRIYSVGLGNDIDPTKLQSITNVTNGYFQVADDLSGASLFDLETFYFKIFANATDLQIALDPTRPVALGGGGPVIVDRVRISSSDHRATFLALDLPETRALYDLELVDPNGNVIGPASTVGGVPVHIVRRGTYTIYKVVFPSGLAPAAYVGDWLLRLRPKDEPPAPAIKSATGGRAVEIGFAAAVGSDYRLGIQLVSSTYLPGSPVSVIVALSDAGWPACEGRVSGSVTAPDHTVSPLAFYDDGTHGDLAARDCAWTGQLAATGQTGVYRVSVRSVGHNARGDLVIREATRFITLAPGAAGPCCGTATGGTGAGGPCGGGPGTGGAHGKTGPWVFGVLTGASWPLGGMRDRYNPASHFGGFLERALSGSLRVGVEAGYHAFDEKAPATSDTLGVTEVSLAGRWLGTGPYRPFVLLGLGGYRALGTWKLGAELGAGVDLRIAPRVSLVSGATFHTAAAPAATAGRLQWIDASLGFAVGFH